MKKMICVLLALTTALSLCACGETNDDHDRRDDDRDYAEETVLENEEPTIPAEPNEEEATKIRDYVSAVCYLKEAAATMTQQADPYKLDEIQGYYQTLMDIGSVEQWANTSTASMILSDYAEWEYAFDSDSDWDLEDVLSRFSVVKDVVLSRNKSTCDNMGNMETTHDKTSWHYNAAGQAVLVANEDEIPFSFAHCISYLDFSEGIREYDQAGRLSKITTYEGDGKILRLCTYTYNENGQLVGMALRENTQSYEIKDFRYDDQGRLTRVEWSYRDDGSQPHAINYTYNEDGTVAMVENMSYVTNDNGEHFVKTREAMAYTYENGVAVSGVYTDQTYGEWYNFSYGVFDTWVNFETIDNYTFSYDQAGRLTTEICHHGSTFQYNTDGDQVNERVSDIATTTYTTVYGDYIVYTPAN
ncbi:MAG: hypothetical protein IJZ56_00125 [Oscillospiraceae bacterium]|nr:hypothetical protein [Oscillospiraceae bacterium]